MNCSFHCHLKPGHLGPHECSVQDCEVNPPEKSHIRTEDYTHEELFSSPSIEWSKGVPEPCTECGALIWELETHVTWHNKLLP